jgi:hypothetical protein
VRAWDRASALAVLAVSPGLRRAALVEIEAEEARAYGLALGLPESDVADTFAAYRAWHREHLCALDPGEVQVALSRRVNGLPWRPDESADTLAREEAARERVAGRGDW